MNADSRLRLVAAALGVALLPLAAPAAAQFGDIGLSGVRGMRIANENLLFFQPEEGDQFAFALATGDFNGDGAGDLATGIPFDEGLGVTDCGAVVVRYGSVGGGLQTGLATNFFGQFLAGGPDPAESGDHFGFSLAACDFNGDDFDDLAIGVPGEDSPVDSGSVEVYYGAAGGLGSSIQLIGEATPGVPGDPESNEYFGYSVACGDLDADGYDDLAIGVPWESLHGDTLPRAGIVEIVFGSESGLDPSTTVEVSQDSQSMEGDPETDDWFGWSLAVGNFNSDAHDDLAIGVPGEDGPSQGLGRGAVHVLLGGTSAPFNALTYTEDDLGGTPEDGDQSGWVLAAGDFDGDLFDDLAVGSPFEDVASVVDAGALHILYGRGCCPFFDSFETWTENDIHGIGASQALDRFSWSIAAGDFDGDGRDDLALGSPNQTTTVPVDGMVTVVMGSAAGIDVTRRHGLTAGRDGNPGWPNQANRNYGFSLATADFDADGHADLVVGAPFEDADGVLNAGAAVVLYGSLFANGFDNGDPGFWSGTEP